MAIIVADALASMRELGRASTACPGAAIGWSLGAEGAWRLAAGADVRAAVLFYPTVRHVSPYRNAAPILALQGGADNVTPEHELRAFAAARADGSAPLEIVTLADAEHGFDVSSISPPRTMRFPPLIGQRATFGYSADASARARAAVEHFLAAQGVIGGTCAPS
jgi:dienelactone hydrolase